MPLYDCMFMLKPQVKRENMMELVARVAKHVYRRNGVVTEIRSFGDVKLGYGIKKLDGRYYQAFLMQMTMMARPSINEELRYLNKEDRLLRWILVKNRGVKYGFEYLSENDEKRNLHMLRSNMHEEMEDEDEDEDDEDDEDVEQGINKE